MRFATLTLLALPLAASIAPAWADPGYDVTILAQLPGTLPGPVAVYGINATGQVVGESDGQATVWTNGQPTALPSPTLPNGVRTNGSVGYAINDAGQVVGTTSFSFDIHDFSFPMEWSGGSPTPLAGAGQYNSAQAINNAGQAAGTSTTESGGGTITQAVSWTGTVATPLANPIGGNTIASGINQAGEIVGTLLSYRMPNPIQAALWSGGTLTSLGVLPGGIESAAYAINNAGQIVGTSWGAFQGPRPAQYKATLWHNGTIVGLGTIGDLDSVALAINNLGQAVGYDGNGRYYGIDPLPNDALLWSNGQTVDLGTILGPRWSSTEATGINDLGDIVGFGVFEGRTNAFLLTPQSPPAAVPEPNGLALLAASLLGWGWRRRQRLQCQGARGRPAAKSLGRERTDGFGHGSR